MSRGVNGIETKGILIHSFLQQREGKKTLIAGKKKPFSLIVIVHRIIVHRIFLWVFARKGQMISIYCLAQGCNSFCLCAS